MVTSRGRTRVALLRLALCYSVVPLRSAHKNIPYEDSKRMCQSHQSNQIKFKDVSIVANVWEALKITEAAQICLYKLRFNLDEPLDIFFRESSVHVKTIIRVQNCSFHLQERKYIMKRYY